MWLLSFWSFQSGHLGNCWLIETVYSQCSHETVLCEEQYPFQVCGPEQVLRKPESQTVKIIKPTVITMCLAKNFICLSSFPVSLMEEVTPCEAARLQGNEFLPGPSH